MASLFGMIVMASLYGFFRDQLFNLLSQETKTATLEDARGALDIMIRELRHAGSWGKGAAPSGCSRVVTATASKVEIRADLNGDGDCGGTTDDEKGERVSYELKTTGSSDCPANNIKRNGVCLVANVTTPTGSLFKYYDASGAETSTISDIKRMKITFSVQVTNPDPRVGGNVASTLSSSVTFRN